MERFSEPIADQPVGVFIVLDVRIPTCMIIKSPSTRLEGLLNVWLVAFPWPLSMPRTVGKLADVTLADPPVYASKTV